MARKKKAARSTLSPDALRAAIADLPSFESRHTAALLGRIDAASVAVSLDAIEVDHIFVRLTGQKQQGRDHWAVVVLPQRDLFAENVDVTGAWVVDRSALQFDDLPFDRETVTPWDDWLAELQPVIDPAGVVIELADDTEQEQYVLRGRYPDLLADKAG